MLLCGVGCMLLSLAVSIELRLVIRTDGQTDGHMAIAYTR